MQAIQTRLYTNAILTVIAILLAVAVLKPAIRFSTPAYAQSTYNERYQKNAQQSAVEGQLGGAQFDQFAAATRMVAEANQDIAKAIREAAASQKDIAKAVAKLSSAQ